MHLECSQSRRFPASRPQATTMRFLRAQICLGICRSNVHVQGGGYKLVEYSVDFQLSVLMRSSYSSQAKKDFVLQSEPNHIDDFTAWIASARSGAQQIEDSQKLEIFSSQPECEAAASQRMLEYLNAGAIGVFNESKANWDTSGLHTYIGH